MHWFYTIYRNTEVPREQGKQRYHTTNSYALSTPWAYTLATIYNFHYRILYKLYSRDFTKLDRNLTWELQKNLRCCTCLLWNQPSYCDLIYSRRAFIDNTCFPEKNSIHGISSPIQPKWSGKLMKLVLISISWCGCGTTQERIFEYLKVELNPLNM